MSVLTMKQLLEAGVHFGHASKKWNPKMKKYIFGKRNDIYIIDLQKTVQLMDKAYDYVRGLVKDGGTVLFVGTKKQAADSIREEAERAGVPYVNTRWLGGTLTNFNTIKKSVQKMLDLEEKFETGGFENLTKKEVLQLTKKLERLRKFFVGVRELINKPEAKPIDAIYIVDIVAEEISLLEARKMGIPVIAIVDTNSDPDLVDYPITGNDDAIRAVKLITSKMADACLEGKQLAKEMEMAQAEGAEEAGEKDAGEGQAKQVRKDTVQLDDEYEPTQIKDIDIKYDDDIEEE